MCPGQDLNLHASRRYHLKVVRLPIPPPGLFVARIVLSRRIIRRVDAAANGSRVAEAEVGFEPTNNGFAIRPLSPLGYSAKYLLAARADQAADTATIAIVRLLARVVLLAHKLLRRR